MFTEDMQLAQAGDVTAIARLGAEAFGEGRIVEAVYWMVMADLRGFQNLGGIITSYAQSWRAAGCPEQIEAVNTWFTEEQRQFGFAALLWLADVDRIFARNWFNRSAKNGNYDARDFKMKYMARV